MIFNKGRKRAFGFGKLLTAQQAKGIAILFFWRRGRRRPGRRTRSRSGWNLRWLALVFDYTKQFGTTIIKRFARTGRTVTSGATCGSCGLARSTIRKRFCRCAVAIIGKWRTRTGTRTVFKLCQAKINVGDQPFKAIFHFADSEIKLFDLTGQLGCRALQIIDLYLLTGRRRGRWITTGYRRGGITCGRAFAVNITLQQIEILAQLFDLPANVCILSKGRNRSEGRHPHQSANRQSN